MTTITFDEELDINKTHFKNSEEFIEYIIESGINKVEFGEISDNELINEILKEKQKADNGEIKFVNI